MVKPIKNDPAHPGRKIIDTANAMWVKNAQGTAKVKHHDGTEVDADWWPPPAPFDDPAQIDDYVTHNLGRMLHARGAEEVEFTHPSNGNKAAATKADVRGGPPMPEDTITPTPPSDPPVPPGHPNHPDYDGHGSNP